MEQTSQDNEASLLKFREKRKWQIALRRYVVEQQLSVTYAPYFGADIKLFRKWIELQFRDGLNWDNFGKLWQLDHILPVVYFDSADQNDLRLCWNFTNIRVENARLNRVRDDRVDALTAKAYFQSAFKATGYLICQEMIKRIEEIEKAQIQSNTMAASFIKDHLDHLTPLATFTEYEFLKLNSGNTLEEIEQERQMLAKFGK